MIQQSLFTEDTGCEQSLEYHRCLGNDLFLDLGNGPKGQAFLYRHGSVIRTVDFSDKVAKKLFVVEVVNHLSPELSINPSFEKAYQSVPGGFVDKGWKNTVLVMPGGNATLLKRFDDFKGSFMYHCHNLEYEDRGMMRDFPVR